MFQHSNANFFLSRAESAIMKREDKKLLDTSIMSRGAFLLELKRTKIKVHFVIVPSRGEGGVFMF